MTQTVYDISVIICAYTEDRWDDLVAAIDSVQQQTLPPKEIIVVIDYNPGLLRRAREHLPGAAVVENMGAPGLSGARNSGVTIAGSQIIAFLDDDAMAAPDWIEHLVVCYTDPHVVGVGGKIEPLWPGIQPFWFPDEFNWVLGCTYRGMPMESTAVSKMIGANMSVRRYVLMAVGGFHESFGYNHDSATKSTARAGLKYLQNYAGGEETELCIRVTQQWPESIWFYTPWAAVQHHVQDKRVCWRYLIWRCFGEGLSKAKLVGLHSAHTALASERTYTFKTLPCGVMRGVTDALFHRDLTGLVRAGTIMVGLAVTTTGYLMGIITQLLILNKAASMSVGRSSKQSLNSNHLNSNINEKSAVVREVLLKRD